MPGHELVDTLKQVLVIPTGAVQRGPNGTFVYVLREDSTVAMRPVAVQKQDETQSVIKNGVQPSERVVTTGFVRLTEGAKVSVGDGDGPAATARPPSNGTPQAGERRRRNGSAARPNTRQ